MNRTPFITNTLTPPPCIHESYILRLQMLFEKEQKKIFCLFCCFWFVPMVNDEHNFVIYFPHATHTVNAFAVCTVHMYMCCNNT